jgi:lysophospholipase L1-like esterase
MNAAAVTMPAKARWALRAVAVIVCAVSLFAATAGSALARSHHRRPNNPDFTNKAPITRGSTYLALGDSVTFGYEEAQVQPAPDYSDASSFLGYPEQMGSALHLNVVNAACPGETSASLIDATAPSNGCENSPGGGPFYRMNPLHVSYSGSQLAFAIDYLRRHGNVRLVSLMIGANDFFLCQETTADHCAAQAEVGAVIQSVSKNVATILSAIRNKAHYRGQLAIVNYYSLDYSNPAGNASSALLNSTQDKAAAPFHVEVADGFGALQAGAAHSGGKTCGAGLLTQLVGGSTPCGIHPSYSGQALLAQALESAVRLG